MLAVSVLPTFIAAGADVHCVDANGDTPLHEKVKGPTEGAVALLKAGANPNARNLKGRSPYHEAVINDHKEMIALLEQYGAKWEPRPGHAG